MNPPESGPDPRARSQDAGTGAQDDAPAESPSGATAGGARGPAAGRVVPLARKPGAQDAAGGAAPGGTDPPRGRPPGPRAQEAAARQKARAARLLAQDNGSAAPQTAGNSATGPARPVAGAAPPQPAAAPAAGQPRPGTAPGAAPPQAAAPAPSAAPAPPPAPPSARPAAPPPARPAAPAGTPAVAPPPAKPAMPPAVSPPPQAPAQAPAQRPTVGAGRMRGRHWGVLLSLLVCVLLPLGVAAWYLWARAADQYASTVGFAVRREDVSSSMEILGGLSALSGSTSSTDTDILYEFIQSQDLVRRIDDTIDLRGIWSKPQNDPIFAYHPPGTIEDLVDQWGRMVKVYYDSGAGLIEVRARAFDPDDAQAITREILSRSTQMINELNDVARGDSLRYAREELDLTVEKLKQARQAMTAFRNRTQIVDPAADVQSQMGLLGTLQTQMADALINLDILTATTRPGDPRIEQAELRVRVIEDRIRDERQKLGIGTDGGENEAFASLVGEYERLLVDQQFAEGAYTAALASYDAAQAEARRTSRYLAAHIAPTRAETARYPQRALLVTLAALFLFMTWAIGVLVYYSIKDRR